MMLNTKTAFQKRQDLYQKIAFSFMRFSVLLVVLVLCLILGDIILNGYSVLSVDFFTKFPVSRMTQGGIYPCIVGTVELVFLSLIVGGPLGVVAAIYLTEYAAAGKIKWAVEQAVNNLAGTPSIIFGLFGMAFFVKYAQIPMSLATASLTMGLLIMPVIIRTTQEALLAVPKEYRDASYALGVTKWETIRRVILPAAYSGMITGVIISIGRAAGETAPILFTGAVYYYPRMPDSIFSPFMALAYHLFVLATESIDITATRPVQYGTALVLLIIVFSMNMIAVVIRRHYKKKRLN